MDKIDFRSDTVSWPTPAMREAMSNARIGDDVYGEDPSVNELEALAAAKVGKEAAVFVASGTMGNLLGVLAHAGRGDEAIVGDDAHTFLSEAGGMAALGGVTPRTLKTDPFGRMDLGEVKAAVRSDDPHHPTSRLILVENSYGNKQGYPIPTDYFAEIRKIASANQMKVHMDGARLFNAAVALNVGATTLTQHVDSVSFCLSKGLCAPVGSLLCGSADFIYRARRLRKAVGGSMRQAGFMAAAGIVALHEMIERLADDHRHAQLLAAELAKMPGIHVDVEHVKTNIVFFSLDDSLAIDGKEIVAKLRDDHQIWVNLRGDSGRTFRAVMHYWVGEEEISRLVTALAQILQEV